MMVIIQTKVKGTSKRLAVKKAATQVLMQEKIKSFTADIFQYFEKNYDQQLDVSLQKLGNLAPGDLIPVTGCVRGVEMF